MLVVTAVLVTAAGAAVTVPLLLASDGGRPLTASPQAPTGPAGPETATPAAPSGASPTTPGPFLTAKPVTIKTSGFWSWALLDTTTGAITGSANLATPSDTASMSKAWVAADYLRRAAEKNQQPNSTIMAELSTMIRDSDTTHAYEFHVANGNLSSITRMIKLCGLTDTKGTQNSWSLTRMSSRDVARLAKCISDGRAAGPKWTSWLLNEMRNVRGPGRFGIIEALPADVAKTTAIKNGWLARDDGQWHIACMAVGDGWTIGIMAHYPSTLGKDYGTKTCREVTKQLLTQPPH